LLKISNVTLALVEAIVEALTLIKRVGRKLFLYFNFWSCEVGI